jgi:hypothetical protein
MAGYVEYWTHSQGKEMETMGRNEGCSIALIGGAIAVLAVAAGLWGALGASTEEHWGQMQACLGLAFVGGVIGLAVFITGIAKAISGDIGSPDSFYQRPLPEKLCPNCGCRVVDGSKTCKWCGADMK